jgi:pyrimidine-nucleoside phosphorylase
VICSFESLWVGAWSLPDFCHLSRVNFLSVIESKRDGKVLSAEQIKETVKGCVSGEIPDYQLAAFLMAAFFRGLNADETTAFTLAMRDSGDKLTFPDDPRPLVDKHSTGGVGDKVSLPLAPLLACLGFRVPMISGRGLGITGGTLDKLDSIPGFQTSLPAARIIELVHRVGCVICGQTDRMVPADKRLYALRDVTGTVPSIPMIVASILSKKLAEGLHALVLDVKFGTAAFMTSLDQARELARAMVELGKQCGVNTRAILTSMDSPLGLAAGNWLEVKEAVACLDGQGPEDLLKLVLICASHLLVQTGKAASLEEARARAKACLDSGEPRRKWDEMLAAQGADLDAFAKKLSRDSEVPNVMAVRSPRAGLISRCDARVIGEVIRDLGGGRATKDSRIDYGVGMDQLVKPGSTVQAGSVLARIHSAKAVAPSTVNRVLSAFEFSDEPARISPLVVESIV